MKKIISVFCIILLLTGCAGFVSGCGSAAGNDRQTVRLSVWGSEYEQDLIEQMASAFTAQYADEADISITVCEESEGTCRDTVLFSPENAADVYAFADDQLYSLVKAGALMSAEEDRETIEESCGGPDSLGLEAASSEGTLYAYPVTASNGYFLYYNSSYFTPEDVRSFDRMLEIAAGDNKKIYMDFSSGWYLYSFFRGAGLDVRVDESTGRNKCNFNSVETPVKGVDVARCIMDIAAHPGFLQGDNDMLQKGVESGEVIAAVSGTWNEALFEEYYGSGYDAAMLPACTISGNLVQMHSVMGYKLVGVNAHSEEKEWARRFALWLTNPDNQLLRFKVRGEGPADVRVAGNESVQASRAIAALSAQSVYGHLQRVGDKYWEPMYRLGVTLSSGLTDYSNLQSLLDDTVEEIEN